VAGAWSQGHAKAWDHVVGQHGAGDFIFFSAYAFAGLVPLLSSFFLTLVEIFVHFYEMFVGMWPSVQLFQCFFIMKAMSQHPPHIDDYYFQRQTQGLSRYIALVQVDAHGWLALPATVPTLDCAEWVKDPGPRVEIQPCARSDLVPGREWPDLVDDAA
jgi:hypothetical protein